MVNGQLIITIVCAGGRLAAWWNVMALGIPLLAMNPSFQELGGLWQIN